MAWIHAGIATSLILLLAGGCTQEPPAPGASSLDDLVDIVYAAHRDNDMDLMRSVLLGRVDRRAGVWPEEEERIERLLARCVEIDEVEAVFGGQKIEWISDRGRSDGVLSPYGAYKIIIHGVWQVDNERQEARSVDPGYTITLLEDGTYTLKAMPLVLKDAVEALEEGREPRYRAVESD